MLLGIICQGKETGNACFWDNKSWKNWDVVFNDPNQQERGLVEYFVGGADVTVPCTKCHAGENAFLFPNMNAHWYVPATKPDVYYEPIVKAGWYQNPEPDVTSGGACAECHGAASGAFAGRFPKVTDALRGGGAWCWKVLQATLSRDWMPPAGVAEDPHSIDALLAECDPQTPCTTSGWGPSGWWKFDDADHYTGYTLDSSVYSNAGAYSALPIDPSGPKPTGGEVRGALSFHNGGSYIDVADATSVDVYSSDWSTDFWIRTSQSSGIAVILDKRKTGYPYTGYHLFLYNGKLALQLANSSGYTNYISNVSVADGNEHHVAITLDRNETDGLRWYVDGNEVGARKNPTGRQGSLANSSPLRIGARGGSYPSSHFVGMLDELRVFRRELYASEISDIYNAGFAGVCL